MIGAKKQQFRLEIRRKQIQNIFAKRRAEIKLRQQPINYQQKMQDVESIKMLFNQLKATLNQLDYFRILQTLTQIRRYLASKSNYISRKAAQQENLGFELIMQVLASLQQSKLQPHNIQAILHKAISILAKIMCFEEITESRVNKCAFGKIIGKILQAPFKYSKKQLQDLFCILGNAVCHSPFVAKVYKQLNVVNNVTKLLSQIRPNIQENVTAQFLFFLRCFLQEIQTQQKSLIEKRCVEMCIQASCIGLHLYLQKSQSQQNKIENLLDAIQVMEYLVKHKLMSLQNRNIPYAAMLNVFQEQFPLEVKKSILFFLDEVVVLDNKKVTDYLVQQEDLILKLWDIQKELHYISLNIIANVAIDPEYRFKMQAILSSLKLKFQYKNHNKYLLTIILNYYCAIKFCTEGQVEESLLKVVSESQPKNEQQLKIYVKIWIGILHSQENDYMPPAYITENTEIEQYDFIQCLLKHKKKMYGFDDI